MIDHDRPTLYGYIVRFSRIVPACRLLISHGFAYFFFLSFFCGKMLRLNHHLPSLRPQIEHDPKANSTNRNNSTICLRCEMPMRTHILLDTEIRVAKKAYTLFIGESCSYMSILSELFHAFRFRYLLCKSIS